jgi:hypothetical protein
VAFVDAILSCGTFSVLQVKVWQVVQRLIGTLALQVARSLGTHLVPCDDRPEDALVQLLQLVCLVFRALIIGFGDVKVSFGVGDAFYVDRSDGWSAGIRVGRGTGWQNKPD